MKTLVRSRTSLAALLVAALAGDSAAAGEPALLPAAAMEIADTVAGVPEGAGGEEGPAEARAGVGMNAGAEARPPSRLLRSLSGRGDQPTPVPPSTVARSSEHSAGAAGGAVSGVPEHSPAAGRSPVFHGCPRELLNKLLTGAAETDDAVSALAIERETLALCRERQEIVTGIVTLEGELRALLDEWRGDAAGIRGAAAGVTSTPIVKESAPVRVVRRMPVSEEGSGASSQAAPPKHGPAPPATPPDYSWFSIIGMAGALQAGVSDGELIWFVREGDRLPGAVVVEEITARPPGVTTRRGVTTQRGVITQGGVAARRDALAGGAGEASLPYRVRPADAIRAGEER